MGLIDAAREIGAAVAVEPLDELNDLFRCRCGCHQRTVIAGKDNRVKWSGGQGKGARELES